MTRPTNNQQNTGEEHYRTTQRLLGERQIRVATRLNVVTGVAAAAGVVGLFFVYLSIIHADRATIDANRGWLAMDSMVATGEISGDKDIDLKIYYKNVGKSPAISLGAYFLFDSIANINKSDYEAVAIGPNKTCDSAVLQPDGPATFPNSMKPGWFKSAFPRKSIPTTALTNDRALYVQGCLIYETMHETHHTWFCFLAYRNGKFATSDATVTCKDGHGAD